MTSDTPDANAQTTAPGLRERLFTEVASWAPDEDALVLQARADAILSITDPQAVRKAALEEAARRVELMTPGGLPHAHPYARQCYIAQAIRALAASPAPTTDTTT